MSAGTTTPIVEARRIGKTFDLSGAFSPRAPLVALDDVTLSLFKGETLGIVGESGSGKTTLGRILLGITQPTSGAVFCDGRPLGRDRRAIARRLGVVFQDPYSSLNPRWTVADTVRLPLDVHGIGRAAERRDRTLSTLNRVGLGPALANRYPAELSGGQRQRVAIARALVLRPAAILLDEPTSALDVSVQAQVLNLLLDLQSEFELAYLFITHNMAVVHHMAHRIVVMKQGRIVEEGAAETVFGSPREAYTSQLLAAMLTPSAGLLPA